MEKNFTTGSVFKAILIFSVPYLISYFLQTLYGMADLFIIGQFCAVESITAVSIGSQVMHMLTLMIVGLAMGSTILIGKAVGSKNNVEKNKVIGNTVSIFMIFSVIATVLLLIAVDPIVNVMSTPTESITSTKIYLTICFLGIPFITAYNVISSIFRGMGDSKSPMYFIAIACAANILIDYIFIGQLNFGPAGAALGTTLSQTISVIISLFFVFKKRMIPGMKKTDFSLDKNIIIKIFKIGIPVALQDGFIQISFIVITIFANLRGLNDAAAVGIVEKLIGIFFLVPSSMLSTVSALSAQNIGANKNDRAKSVLRYGALISVIFGIIISIAMQFYANEAVSLFTKDQVVINLGGQYMKSYVWDCILAGIHFCFSGFFCAYSLSIISFAHNCFSSFLVRIPLAYIASVHFAKTLYPMGFAAPIGSSVSVIICIIAFIILNKKEILNGQK